MRILHIEKQRRMSGQTLRALCGVVGLRARGHSVALCCPPDAAIGQAARAQQIEVIALPMAGARLYASSLRLRRIIRRRPPDLVHAHGSRDHLLAAMALVGARTPLLLRTKHNQVSLHRGPFSRYLYGRLTDHLIAVSRAVRDGLVRDGIPATHISVVYDGIDTGRFSPRPKNERVLREFGLGPEHVVVGAAGRYDSGSMNSEVLALAMAKIAAKYPHVRFLLPGRAKDRLTARVADFGLADRTLLPGFREDMPDLLSVMDILVQPNVKAALGTALLEAQAMGKPVVATRVGGQVESVADGETGLLCPPKDPEAMADAMARLIASPESRAQMGRNARRRVLDQFSKDRMVQALEGVYRRAMAH